MKSHFDLIILGGGPAGTAASIMLSRRGYSVALIDRTNYQAIRPGEIIRPEVKNLLVDLDVFERFLLDGHTDSYGIRSSWGNADVYENHFLFNPFGSGWHLNRNRFDSLLQDAAGEKGACVLRDSFVTQFWETSDNRFSFKVATPSANRQISAKFVIDASGRSAFIARKKRVARISLDKLIGVISLVPMKETQDCFTLVESAENGWWYTAELPQSLMIVAFMTDADLYREAVKRSPDYWERELARTSYTSERIDWNQEISVTHRVAAMTSTLTHFCGNNWLSVGDAAMTFDPLSSQGICKALRSGMNAAIAIHEFYSKGKSLSDYSGSMKGSFMRYLDLRRKYYERERRWKNSIFWRRRHEIYFDVG